MTAECRNRACRYNYKQLDRDGSLILCEISPAGMALCLARTKAADEIRTHNIDLGKVALYH